MTDQTRRAFLTHSSLTAFTVFSGCTHRHSTPSRKPNIVYILADDLGYGDLGCYGQRKIETPNIDRLRSTGMRFTSHYSGSPVCAPSRCVLLTGKHSGHAYIRGNDEWSERGKVWDFQAMIDDPKLEGQRPLPADTQTIGSLLQSGGYQTACVGKWGLGAPGTEGTPNRQGFNLFFGYNCQRQAHTYYPKHLYRNEERVMLRNDVVFPGTKLDAGSDPCDPASYARYTLTDYAPDLMFDEIQSFVNANSTRPFFLYWSTPIPHVALQAPPRWVDHYVKKFGDETPYSGKQGYFPHRHPHACYAAMVSYLDEQVGLLVKQLKALGLYDNTLIFFTSDNGPTFNGGTDSPWFNSGGPFKSEAGWGKCSLHEGGIRVPLVAAWPGRIKPGSQSDHPCAFWDILPTLCEVAGVAPPADTDGISFAPTLFGQRTQREHEYLFWEYPEAGGHQAVRQGRWKAIRSGIKKGNMRIALYDLETDLREEKDVAAQHPDIVSQMEQLMRDARTPPALDTFKLKALGD
jgi:arylsulfatase